MFSGAGCQPCVQPPAILEERMDCFLDWVFITDQSGMGGTTSSYATASIAPRLIRPHKPHHQRQAHAIPGWGGGLKMFHTHHYMVATVIHIHSPRCHIYIYIYIYIYIHTFSSKYREAGRKKEIEKLREQ